MKNSIFRTNPWEVFLFMTLVFVSVESWLVLQQMGLTTVYNDAMSHLNLSRLVIDNQQTGLSQIGGVWLPMSHLLPIILIWNDWAWHSGFAGSLVSMVSYVISGWAIYWLVYALTKNKLASLIGALAFGLNLNMIYLQSTPLTEPLYLVFFILSALFFIKWLQLKQTKYLLISGVFGFCQVLTRYDGWFVVAFLALILLIHEFWQTEDKLGEIVGKFIVFAFPIGFGVVAWLVWNGLIFHDPLFFAIGPYSAHAQQAVIGQSHPLITKGNLGISVKAYFFDVLDNVGFLDLILAGLGSLLVFADRKLLIKQRGLLFLVLLSPVIFNVVALYFGFSILNVPELNWNPSPSPGGYWFNVRYGILALPFCALMVGLFANRAKYFGLVAVVFIVVQSFLTFHNGVITIIDGTQGSSSFLNGDISQKLSEEVKPGENVLLAISYFNPVAFKSGIDLSQIVHEGVSTKWPYVLYAPQKYAKWIVMANGNTGEPVYTSLIVDQKSAFLKYYQLDFNGLHADIYKLKEQKIVTR